MLEENPILRPQHFFQSRIELEFPTTQFATKLQRELYLVGTGLHMMFERKLFLPLIHVCIPQTHPQGGHSSKQIHSSWLFLNMHISSPS